MSLVRRPRPRTTTYGQRGGDGPTAGKKAQWYRVTLPDGTVHRKRAFRAAQLPDRLVATAFRYPQDGRLCVALWASGVPAWEGEFGRLEAVRETE